jgi:hypothetical protein
MEILGQPFLIQNTTGPNWLITWQDAALITNEAGDTLESISFTVSVPKRAELTIEELQRYALKRAVELLQERIRLTPES